MPAIIEQFYIVTSSATLGASLVGGAVEVPTVDNLGAAYIEINSEIDEKKEDVMHVVHEICNQYSIIAGYFQRPRMNEAFAEKAEESAAEVHVGNLFNSKLLSVSCLR